MRQIQTTHIGLIRIAAALLIVCTTMPVAFGCAPAAPTPTPPPTRAPTLAPTATPEPTLTQTQAPIPNQEVEGLVIVEDGEVIIGVEWLDSRVIYRVTGGDVGRVRALEGETVVAQGAVTHHGDQLKEIAVTEVRLARSPSGLSRRVGLIKELGFSMYMQGTHVLTDREGQTICLLSSAEGGPDLDQYMLVQVAVIGVLENTVEGNEKIMKVQRVEKVK
jgi:hypothetical protein